MAGLYALIRREGIFIWDFTSWAVTLAICGSYAIFCRITMILCSLNINNINYRGILLKIKKKATSLSNNHVYLKFQVIGNVLITGL